MKNRALFVGALITCSAGILAAEPLPRTGSPEAQGVSSDALREFVEALDRIPSMHSVMVLRHGQVVAEAWWKPEAADKAHILNSVSKSFCSTAVGLAVAEGKLTLDDRVLGFFPDNAPAEISENLKALRVRDLLTMSSGHDPEPKAAPGSGPTVKQFLATPLAHAPGTHFQYNTMGTYVLSAIVTKVTGEKVVDYLKPRLFDPLGIEGAKWDESAEGYSLGGYGLYLKTEDLAKLGQLYLQKGKWNGKQLITEDWVAQATSKQVRNDPGSHTGMGPDWKQGYGFQFWRCQNGAFRGDGAGGQFCIVLPEQDTVIAMTAGGADMQAELNAIWDKLLPALKNSNPPIPENPSAQAKLKEAIGKLEVKTPPGK
ncbi:serine hydrolase domain-containing protein [Luteolibacter luteus]|uniref:Serine hydrolase n=1 Tax=Luteolibacter luteus TaxID=2728835 RepID=A0A858RJ36_9BACT|nr:serine hydrolase [Luteolibacter luteus]QJE96230.1 serine hydrolase [Luteolibacter luteus]